MKPARCALPPGPQRSVRPGSWPRAARTAALTRTDLLVLLAGLALLAAIVLPTMDRMRTRTRMARCKANLGLISQSVLMYASDHQHTLPSLEASPPPGAWWWYKEQVKRYAGLTGPSSPKDKEFACPEDRGYGNVERPIPFCRSSKYDFTSYVFNGVNLPGIPNIAGWEVAKVRDPTHTLLVMEWTAHAPLSWHNSKTGRSNMPFYNDAESMVGFVDGHVDFIPIYYDGMNPAFTRDPVGGYGYKYSGD